MSSKKIKPTVFKIKDIAESEKDLSASSQEQNPGAKVDQDPLSDFERELGGLMRDVNALHSDKLKKFFRERLHSSVTTHAEAVNHIKITCSTLVGIRYVQSELDNFIGVKIENPPPPTSKEGSSGESEEEEKEEPGSIQVGVEGEGAEPKPDFGEEPEFGGDEPIPQPRFRKIEMPELSDAVEESIRESLKVYKDMLQEQLDRLTICEAKIEQHDEKFEAVSLGFIDSKLEIVKKIDEHMAIFQKAIKEIESKGGSGSGEGDVIITYPDRKPPLKVKGVLPKEFKRLIQLGASRKNILMVGPSGVGKTFIAQKIAEALELRFTSVSCSEGMDEGIFEGKILPIKENGTFDFLMSQFLDYYENGGLFFADEYDAMDSNLQVYTNSAISNGYWHCPLRWKNPLVKRHPDFLMVAAANTNGHGGDEIYGARNALDGSTLDRFRCGIVNMDYSAKVEQKIIDEDVYNWAIFVRKGIIAMRMPRLMTTRFMEDCSQMKADHGWGVKEWEESYFADWITDDIKRLKNWIISDIQQMKTKLEK